MTHGLVSLQGADQSIIVIAVCIFTFAAAAETAPAVSDRAACEDYDCCVGCLRFH